MQEIQRQFGPAGTPTPMPPKVTIALGLHPNRAGRRALLRGTGSYRYSYARMARYTGVDGAIAQMLAAAQRSHARAAVQRVLLGAGPA